MPVFPQVSGGGGVRVVSAYAGDAEGSGPVVLDGGTRSGQGDRAVADCVLELRLGAVLAVGGLRARVRLRSQIVGVAGGSAEFEGYLVVLLVVRHVGVRVAVVDDALSLEWVGVRGGRANGCRPAGHAYRGVDRRLGDIRVVHARSARRVRQWQVGM